MRVSPRSTACLSRLACDRWLNGELDRDVSAHLASCRRCGALVAAHRRERAVFAVPLRVAHRRWPLWVLVVAAMLGLWLVASPPAERARVKGPPALGFYVKHRDVVRRGGAGETVVPDDALNFTASVDRPSYLTIVSIDSASAVSVYYPEGATAAHLRRGQDQLLPRSVVLDGVLGTERIHGVFCDREIAVDRVVSSVRAGQAPPGCAIDSLTIEKRAR